MSGVPQGSWSLGLVLSSAACGFPFNSIGWRGLLIIGVLPALAVFYVRRYVKEPDVWVRNRQIQRATHHEFPLPLLDIFRPISRSCGRSDFAQAIGGRRAEQAGASPPPPPSRPGPPRAGSRQNHRSGNSCLPRTIQADILGRDPTASAGTKPRVRLC